MLGHTLKNNAKTPGPAAPIPTAADRPDRTRKNMKGQIEMEAMEICQRLSWEPRNQIENTFLTGVWKTTSQERKRYIDLR